MKTSISSTVIDPLRVQKAHQVILYAMLGDTWGSLYEKIAINNRGHMTPTDDTFLTLAAYEWMNDTYALDLLLDSQRAGLFKGGQASASEPWRYLVHYFERFESQGFSKRFESWCRLAKSQDCEPSLPGATTNGALMRQTPIVALHWMRSSQKSLMLQDVKTFASPSHNTPEAQSASAAHAQTLWDLLESPREEVSQLINSKNTNSIWQWHKECTKKFNYQARASWDITLALLNECSSVSEACEAAKFIGADVDTYLAICLPLAVLWWGRDMEWESPVIAALTAHECGSIAQSIAALAR